VRGVGLSFTLTYRSLPKKREVLYLLRRKKKRRECLRYFVSSVLRKGRKGLAFFVLCGEVKGNLLRREERKTATKREFFSLTLKVPRKKERKKVGGGGKKKKGASPSMSKALILEGGGGKGGGYRLPACGRESIIICKGILPAGPKRKGGCPRGGRTG